MQQNRFICFSAFLALCFTTVLSCQVIQSGITPQEKATILEAHNRLRSAVAMGLQPGQPGAQNMKEIVWDDELAARAQNWANQCTFKHDPQRTINRFTMGQNMAIIWSTAPISDGDFTSRITNWFKEVNQYAFGSAWSPKTGHYSQLVWADTNMVGCGFTYYKSGAKYNKLFVCNYGPGGNVVGSMPYSVGNPDCNVHGMGSSGRYPGLCASRGGFQNFGGYNSYPSSTFAPSTFVSTTFAPSTFRSSSFAPSTFRSTTFAPSTFRSSSFAPSTFRSTTFAPSTFRSSTFPPRTYYSKAGFSTPFPSASPGYGDYSFKNYYNGAPKPSFGSAWNALQFYKKK